ncbi:PRA1 family protein G2-like isoform X3 [Primulina tabacum]|uniref:PRA1 family protein G2-like isoform X3 n=1 Tax=Primulina tabacum TaxID=48773 RepID=UPI003F5A5679
MPDTSASATPVPPASYTTIPISGGAVISRSTQNLSACLSRARPWPLFLATTAVIDVPPSFSAATQRLRRNASYFSVNYAIIVTACAAVSLIGAPIALILIGFVFFLWLILHFFREDPLLIWGYHVNDWAVILGLVVISIAALWITGPLNNLSIGISVGLLIFVIHGVLRNPEGLYLDENDAVSDGLVSSQSTAFSPRDRVIQFNQPVYPISPSPRVLSRSLALSRGPTTCSQWTATSVLSLEVLWLMLGAHR